MAINQLTAACAVVDAAISNPQKKTAGSQMTQAIKDFKDEFFTGLTDQEREEIDKQIRAYLKAHADEKKVNQEALKNLISHLLLEYGYKGSIEDAVLGFTNKYIEDDGSLKEGSSQQTAASLTAYKLSGQSVLAMREALLKEKHTSQSPSIMMPTKIDKDVDGHQKKDEVATKIVESADGSKVVLMIRNNRIINKIKLSPGNASDMIPFE